MSMSVNYPPGPGEGGFGTDTNSYPPKPQFTTNDLYLQIQQDPNDATLADLSLHVVNKNLLYQWVATTDLNLPFGVPPWVAGEITN